MEGNIFENKLLPRQMVVFLKSFLSTVFFSKCSKILQKLQDHLVAATVFALTPMPDLKSLVCKAHSTVLLQWSS